MKTFVTGGLLLVSVGLAAAFYVDTMDTKIVGGEPTTIQEYPYQLALESGILGVLWSFSCGAVVLNENQVLTAGHCAHGVNKNGIRIRSGSTNHGNGDIHTVSSISVHPDYVERNGIPDNDIAILTIDPPFVFGETVQPINITDSEPVEGDNATITGWGITSENGATPSMVLRTVTVPIVGRSSCAKSYAAEGEITEGMICAGLPEGGKDACSGDSGGPLAVNGKLAGLVSWGLGCAEEGYPGVYTNVAPYVSWVMEQQVLF